MSAIRDMIHHPSHRLESAYDALTARPRKQWSIAGLIALVLATVGFIAIFPEIRRYLRMERM